MRLPHVRLVDNTSLNQISSLAASHVMLSHILTRNEHTQPPTSHLTADRNKADMQHNATK